MFTETEVVNEKKPGQLIPDDMPYFELLVRSFPPHKNKTAMGVAVHTYAVAPVNKI